MTLLQIRSGSNLSPPHPTKHFHRFIASNHYTANKQTQNPFSCHLAFARITYAPKLHWSWLQNTFWKWFTNQVANRLLSWFYHVYNWSFQVSLTETSLGNSLNTTCKHSLRHLVCFYLLEIATFVAFGSLEHVRIFKHVDLKQVRTSYSTRESSRFYEKFNTMLPHGKH